MAHHSALKKEKYNLSKEEDVYVWLRELSSKELRELQVNMGDKETSNMDFVYSILALCVIDDAGKPLFTSIDDVKDNLNVGLSTLVDMQNRILKLSGLETAQKK